MFKTQAIILAGGQGMRLRPYTTILPKPLMPLGDYPIAEVIIRQLKRAGLKNITISTGHLAELIEAYFGDGKKWGVNIRYVREQTPLGTAGALKLVRVWEDDVLVINGDVLTDINFKELMVWHRRHKAMATITIKKRVVKTNFGVIDADAEGNLTTYIEKPEHQSHVSMGIYILQKSCKRFLKPGQAIGMPDLLLNMKAAGHRIQCHKTRAMWLDLGRLDDFDAAQDIFLNHQDQFLP